MNEKISIIGAGISGLTLGIALQQSKINFEIFESFDRFKYLGAGIILAPNALKVLGELGLSEKIRQNGIPLNTFNIRDHTLNRLSKIPQDPNVGSIAIHRGSLQKILQEEIYSKKIHLGKKLQFCKPKGDELRLIFDDITRYDTRVLIGADGIYSKVRNQVVESSQIRDAGQICFRGITEESLPEKYYHELNELWGKGRRFGFVRINKNQVYWYAVLNSTQCKRHDISSLTEKFGDFNPLINRLISSTPESSIIENKMQDLKPISNWYNDNTCLIGDAAHATTPNMGQGACQGIEDGLVLAQCLSSTDSPRNGFERFQKLRKRNALKVVNVSWMMGKIAHLENPFVNLIRNSLMKMIPTTTLTS